MLASCPASIFNWIQTDLRISKRFGPLELSNYASGN